MQTTQEINSNTTKMITKTKTAKNTMHIIGKTIKRTNKSTKSHINKSNKRDNTIFNPSMRVISSGFLLLKTFLHVWFVNGKRYL